MGIIEKFKKLMGENGEPNTELERAERVLEIIEKKTLRQTAKITLTEKKPTIFESKAGGKPYLPKGESVPKDKDGRDLRLLAQINCEDIKGLCGFPQKGMLQFFVADDDIVGADFDNMTEQSGFKVIYREEIDFTVDESDIPEWDELESEWGECFPVIGEWGMEFTITEQGMSANDYRFNDMFTDEWNRLYPDQKITRPFDFSTDVCDFIYESAAGIGDAHRMGGYAGFTQEDPRAYREDLRRFDTLLFQLDSASYLKDKAVTYNVIWGDCGVGNFFITKEKLENLEFDEVMYTWDCF